VRGEVLGGGGLDFSTIMSLDELHGARLLTGNQLRKRESLATVVVFEVDAFLPSRFPGFLLIDFSYASYEVARCCGLSQMLWRWTSCRMYFVDPDHGLSSPSIERHLFGLSQRLSSS